MDTEGLGLPAVANKMAKEGPAAAVKGSTSKQKNDGPPKAKPTTGNQAKVGTMGSRQPISNRAAPVLQSRVAGGGKKKNEQEQKASTSKTIPGSGASSHAKIMEKKMAARDKASKENASGARGVSENGNLVTPEKSGGPGKVLPTSKTVPKGKNPPLLRPNSTVSKTPAVAMTKLSPARPEKTLQSKSSRPDTAASSSHLTQSTGAVRKWSAPRVTNERQTPAQLGSLPTGAQPGKHSAASTKKAGEDSTSQPKHSSSELNRATNTVRSTRPKPVKASEAPVEQKNFNARLKGKPAKVAVKCIPRAQPGTSASKASVSSLPQQSTKAPKSNIEKRRLSSSSRKSLVENEIGKTSAARQTGIKASPVKSVEAQGLVVKEEGPTLTTASSNEDDVAMNLQGYLTMEKVPSPPQGVQTTLDHGNTEISASFDEEQVEDERVEVSSCMGELETAENEAKVGSDESPLQLDEENKGELSPGQMIEADLCSNEVQKDAGVVNGNDPSGGKVNEVDLSKMKAEQINVDEKVASIGKMDLNNDNRETKDLQGQQLLPESSSPSSAERGSQSCAMDVSPMEYVPAIKDGSVGTGTMLEDLVDLKEPALGSSLDESSPETDCNMSNVEKVKLTMYEYSEEADTEDSPNELCPETLQSQEDQDLISEPENLLETMQMSCKMEGPVRNWGSEEKLGISPEDSHEDQGVSKSSTLSGPDLAGKSSSTTSTPEELKDYDSSSGVESKSDEKLESADLFIPQTELSPLDDLMDQDLGIHLERGDEEPETLAADDLHGDPPTEPMLSSEDEDHSEDDGERVTGEPIQCGLEGIDNPVFEDKTSSDLSSEVLSLAAAPHFKPVTLHALDESEELATAAPPHSLAHGYTTSDSLAPQNCMLSDAGSLEDPPCDRIPAVIGLQSCGPEGSLQNHCLPQNECLQDVPEVTLTLHHEGNLAEDETESDQSKSCIVEESVAENPIDCLDGDLTNVQKLNDPTTEANGGHRQQQYDSACKKNDSVLTGLLSEGDKTLQTHACVPWMTPLLPPILSTIYEVETAEETRLEDVEKEELHKCLELIEDPSEKVLTLQIEPVEVVQQLINQTLLLSGDGVKLQSKVMVDKAELSKWTDLISPLDDSTASVTSVTSFSPEDVSSSPGEWTVVELETHH
ncbi:AP2-interacting clathrin-endocytosis protein-like [Carcharodon carcharias]|uniref:AP2-interacting clathrin-endocytosis protein-like n=1 Tax=Carcharodon carcharias TaxID=13397 RepID=UPI001B7E1B06|nr:AP2-interacting clathrin-endocytosis protein-like [Carcharodon carcharias]